MNNDQHHIGRAAKVGALLLLIWSILHIWVGFEGIHQYLTNGTPGMWNGMIGGQRVPRDLFVHATDAPTIFAHGQLMLNFMIDVGGYGVLGLFLTWLIGSRGSWLGYAMALVVIGIADLTFLFAMVLSGTIEFSPPALIGPIIWFLAMAITPFGLPSWKTQRLA